MALYTFIGLGIGLDLIGDGIQTFFAFMIFEDPLIPILAGGGDAVLPPAFDVLPTFTALVIAREKGMLK